MSDMMTKIGDGVGKFAEDLTIATQPLMELPLQASFEFLLKTAVTALLS